MTASRPLRADAARNRAAIVSAARAAFDRGELDRRFDDFALLAGVGTGTLYRNFPTREALAEAVYREEIAALRDHASRLLADRPPVEALAVFLRDFVDRMAAQEGLARTLSHLLRDRPAAQAEGGRVLEDAVTGLVAAAVDDGGLTDGVTAGAIMMALHGIGSSYGRPGWRADADALVDALVRR